ncbi:MAG: hypothetical protein AAGF99_07990 [Bacteroidota bacterium]
MPPPLDASPALDVPRPPHTVTPPTTSPRPASTGVASETTAPAGWPATLADEPTLESAPDLSGTRPLSYRIANALSFLINPLVLPPTGFGLTLAHFGASGGEITWVVTVGVVFFGLVPLTYIGWMVATGRARSVEVRERDKRTGPLAAGIIGYIVGVLVIAFTGQTAVPLLIALALTFPVNTTLVLLITLRFKISIHVTAVAGFVAGLLFVTLVPWAGLPQPPFLQIEAVLIACLMLPLIMWARVHAKAHTVQQVMLGAVFGTLLPLAELSIAWQLGWLGPN